MCSTFSLCNVTLCPNSSLHLFAYKLYVQCHCQIIWREKKEYSAQGMLAVYIAINFWFEDRDKVGKTIKQKLVVIRSGCKGKNQESLG